MTRAEWWTTVGVLGWMTLMVVTAFLVGPAAVRVGEGGHLVGFYLLLALPFVEFFGGLAWLGTVMWRPS